MINSFYYGENNDEAYRVQSNSPAVGSGFLISGSTDSINYLQHNGGLDYFGNNVSHNSPSNIGAYNGFGAMNILEINKDKIKLYPSVTKDYLNIEIEEYSGTIRAEIYALNGDFIAVQYGDRLSFEQYKSGTYFCVIIYANKNKTLRVVKL